MNRDKLSDVSAIAEIKVLEDLKKAIWYLNREIERMKHE